MAFKFATILVLVVVANAGVVPSDPSAYATAQDKSAATYMTYTAPASQAAPLVSSHHKFSAPVSYSQLPYAQIDHSQHEYSQPAYSHPAYHSPSAEAVKTQPEYKAVGEYDPHPQYKFEYGVEDSVSGDTKSQMESRDGDHVQGEYSLIDADGFKRTVKYTADAEHGFNAVVHREPVAIKTENKAVPLNYAAAPVVENSYASPDAAYGH